MNFLDLVGITKLMDLTVGNPDIELGLIDGPIVATHKDLKDANIREIRGRQNVCTNAGSAACIHGTFVAGILSGKRGSLAPSICPGCTLLIYPIFAESSTFEMPSTTPRDLAQAIVSCIDSGAHVLNLSVALTNTSKDQYELENALDYASKNETLIVTAAGNQGTLGSSIITRHPWVIPVAACDINGRPMDQSNLGISIGRRGLRAPGEGITSLAPNGGSMTLGGTSFAAPFVTGAAALLWSQFPDATAAELKMSLTRTESPRRTVVPPLLDAWAAYQSLARSR